jgi:leucine dehydrogenase
MKFKIIAGSANNQLKDENRHGALLEEKGILYAPDYIINAGGVINVYYEAIKEYNEEKVTKKAKNIYNTLEQVYKIADAEKITTAQAAARLAERRIHTIGSIHQKHV